MNKKRKVFEGSLIVGLAGIAAIALTAPPVWAEDGVFETKVGAEGKPVTYRWNDSVPPLLNDFGLQGVNDLARQGLRSANSTPGQKSVTYIELDAQGNPAKFDVVRVNGYSEQYVEYIERDGSLAEGQLVPIMDEEVNRQFFGLASLINPDNDEDNLSIIALTLIYRALEHSAALAPYDSRIQVDAQGLPQTLLVPVMSKGTMKTEQFQEWRLVERPVMNGAKREKTINRSIGRSDSGTIGLEASAEFGFKSLTSTSNEVGGGGNAGFSLGPISLGGSAEAKTTDTNQDENSQTFSQSQNASVSAKVDQNIQTGEKVTLEANTAYAFWGLWNATELTIDGLGDQTQSIVEFVKDGEGLYQPTRRTAVGASMTELSFVVGYDDSGSRDTMPR